MKRAMIFVSFTSLVLLMSFCTPCMSFVHASSLSDNSVMVMSGSIKEQNELEIVANLTENTGTISMNLQLDYNENIMHLTGFEPGTALSSLNLISTNPDTEKGYSIMPFMFNYLGNDNDNTTGRLLRLHFALNENIEDGDYLVTFRYEKNKDINYIENKILKTKNMAIDPVKVHIEGHQPSSIETITYSGDNAPLLIIILSLVGVFTVLPLSIFLISLYRKRGWKKI